VVTNLFTLSFSGLEGETNPSPSLVLPLPLGGGGHRWGRENIRALPKWLVITVN